MKIGPNYIKIVIKRLNKSTKFDESTGCKLWLGSTDIDGYGYTSFFNRNVRVHRLSMYLFNGFDLNNNLQINHKDNCPNKNCWEVSHLYVGTHSENMNDSVRVKTHINSQKTHCPKGHPYDKITRFKGKLLRRCSICMKEVDKRKHLRRKRAKLR